MTAAARVSISAEPAEDRHGQPRIHLKVGLSQCEINLCLDLDEVPRLAQVSNRPWVDGAIAVGSCLGVPAHWSSDDGTVSVLVGHDDQTWDVGVELSAASFSDLLREVERCRDGMGRSGASP